MTATGSLPTSQVVKHVVDSISPASETAAAVAKDRVQAAASPLLESLGARIAGAQHTARIRAGKRMLVIAIGDHGVGDPGIAMGAGHPTVVAAHAIADGSAGVCSLARGTPLVLVEAGAREPSHLPRLAISLGALRPSRDLIREPALSIIDALLGLEAGIALSLSLSEQGLDILGLGAIGLGAEVASAALVGAATGRVVALDEHDDLAELALVRGITLHRASALELLATFGGTETAVLAGLILGAASLNVPVILDGYATGAAALVAVALAPAASGYLVASQRGRFTMPAIIDHLGVGPPAFEGGIGHGDGSGPAMVMPLVEQVAALAERS